MSLFRKRCPYCSQPLSFRKLFLSQPHSLNCPACGARMGLGPWPLRLFGSITGTLFSWTPIYLAFQDHRWWFFVIPGLLFNGLWQYVFLCPRRVRGAT
ncbi:MAG: hypothetical protein IPJ24_05045 [bacterium]|nr:hypothetical protein [bacterium]